ncbi:hypothetical protein VP137E351_P0055 [Vibrio phage 137E35-1]|nr:hypothetical protein VP137E351_P0055 [Vibrio phage 137E35-1]CAH9016485.1 hypothetical protein VP230E391_P0055 [Vibrio phage 230E39-1]
MNKELSPLEKHDIAAGMRPAPARKDTPNQNNPTLIAQRKRIREMQYALEDEKLLHGEIEVGEFDSNWSTGSRTRRNQQNNSRY